MEIRRLTEADIESFHVIRMQALHDSPAAFGKTPEEYSQLTDQEVLKQINSNESFVVGAFERTSLIGIAGIVKQRGIKREHIAVVWGMYVGPAHRKNGIGKLLLEQALSYAKDTGILILNLSVNAESAAAKNLYKALGFSEWGFEPKALKVGNKFFDEIHMRLEL